MWNRSEYGPHQLVFDTLQLAKDLRDHFPTDQAEAIATALSRNASERIATKDDVADLKAGMAGPRADMATKWIVSAIAFNFLATAGLFIGVFKLSTH